jgi:hypothetical protein
MTSEIAQIVLAFCAALTLLGVFYGFCYSQFFRNRDGFERVVALLSNNRPLNVYQQLILSVLEKVGHFFGPGPSAMSYDRILLIAIIYPIVFFLISYGVSGENVLGSIDMLPENKSWTMRAGIVLMTLGVGIFPPLLILQSDRIVEYVCQKFEIANLSDRSQRMIDFFIIVFVLVFGAGVADFVGFGVGCIVGLVIEAITVNLRETCQAALFASGYGAVFYISLVYIPTWLGEYSQASKDLAMNFNTIATALVIILAPVAGWLSDKYMRRTRLLAVVFFLEAVLAVPLFLWMNMTGSVLSVIVSQLLLGGLIAFPCGIAPAVFVELFPTEDRLSGYSIAFNLGIGVIGGSTPMMSTWLISKTGMSVSPGIYISIWALLAVTALLWMKDRSREPLRK